MLMYGPPGSPIHAEPPTMEVSPIVSLQFAAISSSIFPTSEHSIVKAGLHAWTWIPAACATKN